MKLLHLADLHIGKQVNGFSMIEDQKYILTKIINVIDAENPQVVVIAGDVYDKSVPSAEAVTLFDDFLTRLAERKLQVFVISGNHDSPERIAFGGRLMDVSGVHMSPIYQRDLYPTILKDEHGEVNFYLLPFIKPVHVRTAFEEDGITSYTEALHKVIDNLQIDRDSRNVLVTHQFVAGSERSDSEEISVGGTDNIPGSVFDDFDYVALGHIHKPQHVGRKTLRYSGSPLKYSFSEANHQKSVTIVELGEKGAVDVRTVPLIPKRDLVELRGEYAALMERSYYENLNRDDYYHITLTDEEDILDVLQRMRINYPNIMKLDYDNHRTQTHQEIYGVDKIEEKSPLELVQEFYELQNNMPMSSQQQVFVEKLMEEIWEVK